MSSLTLILVLASISWIALCYFLLFRKKSYQPTTTSVRSDEDVIAFPSKPIQPSAEIAHPPAASSIIQQEEIVLTPTVEQSALDENKINDEDLIDIRTLSLNITNEN